MEKKDKLIGLFKFAKVAVLMFYCLFFIVIIFLQFWSNRISSSFSISPLTYWTILVGWLMLVLNYKWRSPNLMIQALIFFITGVFFATVGLKVLAEFVMRISFIGWIVGIIQRLIEYGKENTKK